MGGEGQKQEIHLAGKRKGGQMSKSVKMKLVAILSMLEEGPEGGQGGGFPPCTVGPEMGRNHYLGHVQFPPPHPTVLRVKKMFTLATPLHV